MKSRIDKYMDNLKLKFTQLKKTKSKHKTYNRKNKYNVEVKW
jgi:hypothetical protein